MELMKKKLAVFIEWATYGRDFEIDLPLMYFFENVLQWEVQYVSIFNLPKILSTRPDLVIMSNTTGSNENLAIARLIEKAKIPFFSHISEGMFRENNIEEFVWGWNKVDKKFSELLSTIWSKKAYSISLKYYPELNDIYKISGSIGSDKYKLYSKKDHIYSLKNKKVIGYAGYDFHNQATNIKNMGEARFKEFEKYIKITKNILEFILNTSDDIVLFVKPHPGDGNKTPKEIEGLEHFENILVQSDISIVTAIRNSDIWLSINSSTNLESWLLGKPSISFVTDEKFFSSDIINGSLIENNAEKIYSYINEYYQTGQIKAFEEKKMLREKLISDYIGFSDGLNHVRFMSFLKSYIEKIENGSIKKRKWKISLKDKLKGYVKHYVYLISKGKYNTPLLKRWARPYDIFDDKQVEEQKRLRYPDFDKFYKDKQEQIDIIYENWCKNWKHELGIKE